MSKIIIKTLDELQHFVNRKDIAIAKRIEVFGQCMKIPSIVFIDARKPDQRNFNEPDAVDTMNRRIKGLKENPNNYSLCMFNA